MMLGAYKPLLTALVMPPMALLLLALFGLLLVLRGRHAKRRRIGSALIVLSLVSLGVLSCHGTAVWLAEHALASFKPASAQQLAADRVQAIVVLGGGVLPVAPEYGQAQPSAETAARLRYGIWLARQTRLPLAFSGGVGWGASNLQEASEAAVAQRIAQQENGVTLRWVEGQSRDTAENARRMAPLLAASGIQRIALVTHASHMPRAVAEFERTGLLVTPAPMGFVLPRRNPLFEWLPSAEGLQASQQVLRELVGGVVARLQQK
ncbi:MAG: YdcF family protein [Candidatus Saccharibacteria bacterium]|nr:YdcF family protein [Rhodoferax sp.]